MNLLIVSGLSGAGKSVAMNALEDIGFFCIDNIPAALLPSITAFSKAGDNQLKRVALCMDVRGCRTPGGNRAGAGSAGRSRGSPMRSCSWTRRTMC